MKLEFLLVLFGTLDVIPEGYAKAGRQCRRTEDCGSVLMACNRNGLCQCHASSRQHPVILRLLEVCRTDTEKMNEGNRCVYFSQCDWEAGFGCLEGLCGSCKEGYRLSENKRACVLVQMKAQSTTTIIDDELEKKVETKSSVYSIIGYATSTLVFIAFIGAFYACCKNRSRAKNRLEDIPDHDAFPTAPPLDYEKSLIATEHTLPEYSERFPAPHEGESVKRTAVDEESGYSAQPDCSVTVELVSVNVPLVNPPQESTEHAPWDQWIPPQPHSYRGLCHSPPAYDLNKYLL